MRMMLSLGWRKFSSSKREGWCNKIKKSEELKLGEAPMDLPSIFQRRLKRLSLGMPKASPSSSANYHVISRETICLFLHIICAVLGASVCFYFQFVYILSSGHNLLDPSNLVWERDTLRFFIRILLFFTYTFWVFISSVVKLLAFVFMYLLSELLVLLKKVLSCFTYTCLESCLNKLIGVWLEQKMLHVVIGIMENAYVLL